VSSAGQAGTDINKQKVAGDVKIYLFEFEGPGGRKIGGRKHWVQIPDNTEASP
jgi:hypothetical protein